MSDLKLQVGDAELTEDAQAILKKLIEFNEAFVGRSNIKELTVTLKDQGGQLIAGLNGYTHWNWLFVKLLWTDESYRDQGLGRKLMAAAEEEALERGATHAWVDTFSVEAKAFYEALGYQLFGELPDYPTGHRRFFLQKALA